jgi:hypothetical protein
MSLPPWFVYVRFRSDSLYQWAREIPGVSWDKVQRALIVPTDVLPLLRAEAKRLEVPISISTSDPGSNRAGTTPPTGGSV